MPTRPPLHRPAGWTPPAERDRAYNKARAPEQAKIYDWAWRKLRAAFLTANPVCCHPGCGAPATEADHVLSVRERPDLRLDWDNLRALCKAHHSSRTARDQGYGRAKRDGMP
jgi:5-methylcytosine-specific restriction endonuclease McrA